MGRLRGLRRGQKVAREARANVFLQQAPGVWRLVISLDEASVIESRFLPEAQADDSA